MIETVGVQFKSNLINDTITIVDINPSSNTLTVQIRDRQLVWSLMDTERGFEIGEYSWITSQR